MSAENGLAPVLTIDGPSGSGKGTIAKLVAAKLEWQLLDSGALYRILGLAAQQAGISTDEVDALQQLAETMDVRFIMLDPNEDLRIFLEGKDVTDSIRTEEAGMMASKVAKIPQVREGLLARQKAFRSEPGLVADGRDMGTVVFPDATCKIFLTASAEERARRRCEQLKRNGVDASLSALVESIRERDEQDMNRAVAPLKPADDATVIDSSELSIAEVLERVLRCLDGCASGQA